MEERRGGKQDRAKRNRRLMIYLISAIMLFSGIYIGVNDSQPKPKEKASDYSSRILEYKAYPIGNASSPVRIEGDASDLILMFTQPGYLDQSSVQYILEENITGVGRSTFEVSGSYSFFRFVVDDSAEAEKGVKGILRTRAYAIYRVYGGTSAAGKVSVIGYGLKRGDYVKALLFQRAREGVFDLIGFSQGVVPYGNIVKANLTNVTGFLFNGVLDSYLSESVLNGSVVNLSELRMNQPRLVIHAANYTVGINATVYSDGNSTVVEGRGLDKLAREVKAKNVSFEAVSGRVSFLVPLDSDLKAIERVVNASGIGNVSRTKVGITAAPPEITDGRRIFRLSNSKALDTMILDSAKVGDEINVSLSIVTMGDYNLVFAKQV